MRIARVSTVCVSVATRASVGGGEVNKFKKVSNLCHQMSLAGVPRPSVPRSPQFACPGEKVGSGLHSNHHMGTPCGQIDRED